MKPVKIKYNLIFEYICKFNIFCIEWEAFCEKKINYRTYQVFCIRQVVLIQTSWILFKMFGTVFLKVLLVIGGQAPKAIRSVECFDFKEERWYQLAEMPTRRCRCGKFKTNTQDQLVKIRYHIFWTIKSLWTNWNIFHGIYNGKIVILKLKKSLALYSVNYSNILIEMCLVICI